MKELTVFKNGEYYVFAVTNVSAKQDALTGKTTYTFDGFVNDVPVTVNTNRPDAILKFYDIKKLSELKEAHVRFSDPYFNFVFFKAEAAKSLL